MLIAASLWALGHSALERLSLFFDDRLNRSFPAKADAAALAIVEIDDESMGRHGAWPWPRETFAGLMRAVAAGKPAAVFVDVLFLSARPGDDALASSFAALGDRLVLATGASIPGGNVAIPSPVIPGHPEPRVPTTAATTIYTPEPALLGTRARRGLVTMTPDSDGLVRSVPCAVRDGDRLVLWGAFETAAAALGRERAIALLPRAVDRDGRMLLRYPGSWASSPWEHFSAGELLDALSSPSGAKDLEESLAGKTVLIGSSAMGEADLFRTPADHAAPGVWIHAVAFNQLATGQFVTRLPFAPCLAALLAIASLAGFFGLARTLPWLALGAVELVVLWGAATVLYARGGVLVPLLALTLVLVGQCAGAAVAGALRTYAERTRVSIALSRYVSPDLLQFVLRNPRVIEPGMARQEMTVLFSDIVGFSTVANAATPDAVLAMLQEYLAEMSRIILSHEGTIDKIMGDGMLVLFGAPRPLGDHAARAVRTAAAMQLAMAPLGDAFAARGYPRLRIRIGVNTAEVLVGNIGTEDHIEYTTIGAGVNLAQRFESAAPPGGVLMGARTYDLVRDEVQAEETRVTVKGFDGEVTAYLLRPCG